MTKPRSRAQLRMMQKPTRKAVQAAIAAQAPTDMECRRCFGTGKEIVGHVGRVCGICGGTGHVPWRPAARDKRRAAKIVEESLEGLGDEKSERGEN